jgi:peptide deformylase
MALLQIARMGHPVLRQTARPVDDPRAPEVATLVASMRETMLAAPGVGLAAPQVYVSQRIVVFQVPGVRAADPAAAPGSPRGPVPFTVLINPEIEPLDETQAADWEACLSVPGLTGMVPRYLRIRYTGFGLDGSRIERVAEGFHARVVQHECDHLDGMLYPMRMPDLATLGFVEETQRALQARAAAAGGGS